MGLLLLDEALVEWYARLVLILELSTLLEGLVHTLLFVHLDFGLGAARFCGLRICSSFFAPCRWLLPDIFLFVCPAGVLVCA